MRNNIAAVFAVLFLTACVSTPTPQDNATKEATRICAARNLSPQDYHSCTREQYAQLLPAYINSAAADRAASAAYLNAMAANTRATAYQPPPPRNINCMTTNTYSGSNTYCSQY